MGFNITAETEGGLAKLAKTIWFNSGKKHNQDNSSNDDKDSDKAENSNRLNLGNKEKKLDDLILQFLKSASLFSVEPSFDFQKVDITTVITKNKGESKTIKVTGYEVEIPESDVLDNPAFEEYLETIGQTLDFLQTVGVVTKHEIEYSKDKLSIKVF